MNGRMTLRDALTLARNIEIDGRLLVTEIRYLWDENYQVEALCMVRYDSTGHPHVEAITTPGEPVRIIWNVAPGLNTARDASDDIDGYLERLKTASTPHSDS